MLKIYGEPELPNRVACLRYVVYSMVNPNRHINSRLQHQQKTKPLPPPPAATAKKQRQPKNLPPPGGNRKKTHQQQKASLTKWIGCRKFHDLRPQRNRHDHPVHEGSKVVGFTRSSPSRVWKLQLKSKRFSHLVLLSRNIGS